MKLFDHRWAASHSFLLAALLLPALQTELGAQVPVITAQPQSQTVGTGTTATFNVTATGATSCQWLFNGIAISGATDSTLTLTNVATSQAGPYSVYLANSSGSVTSNPATLTVVLLPSITSSATATGYVGGDILYTITATNSPTSFGVQGTLPPGLMLTTTTGVISGSPTAAGTYAVTISATNSNGTGTASLTVTVNAVAPVTYSFSTLAGNGSLGSLDGTGANAQFSTPQGVAVDANGVVYVADTGNNTIRKITPGGTVTTIAGTAGVIGGLDGTGTSAQFNGPSAIAVDSFGNLFVADSKSSTIRKITPAGVVTTIAGFAGLTGTSNGAGGGARFNNPEGLAIDSSGNLYIADTGNGLVRQITPSGTVTTVATSANPWLLKPYGIAVDGTGTIYVFDSGSGALVKIAPSGSVSLLASVAGSYGLPSHTAMGGLALDTTGNAYLVPGVMVGITNSGAQLWQISSTGTITYVYSWSTVGYKSIPIGTSTGIAVDKAGNLYLSGYSSVLVGAPAQIPAISSQPQNLSVPPGGSATFSASATGIPVPTYQWQLNGTNIVGATNSALALASVMATQAGSYTVVVSNASGTVTSNPATLTVAPTITVEPQPQTAVTGTTAVFSVTATGATGYQWVFNGTGIGGATNAKLTLTKVTASQGGSYSVYVFNGSNYLQSSTVNLTVLPTPVVTSPTTATTYLGGTLLYTSTASNSPTSFGIEGNLPPGCVFNPATGVISGSPTATGTYPVTILADNGYGVGSTTLTITVNLSPVATLTSLTLAGIPGFGAGSTDGIGSNAQFSSPQAVTVDGSGAVYVADTGNNTIRKITPDGTVTTMAGTAGVTGTLDGTGSAAQFNAPSAIVVDATGDLFVTDTNSSTIRKITPAGVVTTLAGLPGVTGNSNGNGPAALFHQPKGIAIDSNGVLFVSDTGNGSVRRVTSSGVVTTVATSGSIVLIKPTGIAVDGSGTIFVFDSGNYGILKIAPSGIVTLLANIYYTSLGIALDSSGNLNCLVNWNAGGSLYIYQLVQITPAGAQTGAQSVLYGSAGGVTGAIATDPQGGFIYITGNAVFTLSPAAPPSITVQPQSESIVVGSQGALSVTSTGVPSPTYQWQFDGTNIVGATSSTLALSNMSLSGAGAYTVVVSNASARVTSDPATVTVTSNPTGPSITSQPQSETVAVGTAVILGVSATGNGDSFQWIKNGITITGATGSAYTIPNAQAGNGGTYSVVITNAGGIVTSTPVHLGVNVAPGVTNLSNWTSEIGLPTSAVYTSVAFDGSSYVAAGSDGSLFVSTHGTNWTSSASAPDRLNSLIYVGAPYGVLGVGDNGVILSALAPSYAPLLQTSGSNSLLTGIAVGNGRMVAVGFAGAALSSASAVPAWAPGVTGVTANLNAIAFGNGTFAAVGLAGTVITSTDGLLWTQQSLGAAMDLYSIAYGPAGFVAIGNNGTAGAIFTSPDGVTWTPQPSPTTNTLIRVIFADGTFVAVGSPGIVITSTDGGFTWSATSVGTSGALEGVAFGSNSFVTVGANGVVAQSAAFAAATFTTQPVSQTVTLGSSITLTGTASGASLTYQWSLNGTPISGATNASYTINSATSANVGSYTVTATNSAGSVTSSGGVLAVQANGAPAITFQPQPQTMAAGSTLVMTVSSTGTVAVSSDPGSELRAQATSAPSYQWYFNGVAISGATSAILELSNVSSATAGTYSCLVSNASGSTLSNAAAVAVTTTTDPGRLINLSTLAVAGSGSQLLTVGFFTGGAGTTGSQPLLIQALGPVMATLVAPGAKVMPDPQLHVFSGQTVIASNAGWGTPTSNQQAVTAADAATGATALPNPASKDSATVVALPPGGYTVQVGSVSGAAGTTLTAFYDDTPPGTYTASSPRLINISCLLNVAANGSLTTGFWIGGTTSKTVLIRANGPALLAQNVTGVMPDPQLTVYNAADSVIAYNAGWGGSPILASISNSVQAQPFTNPNSEDSEVVLTLAPGGYTAQVSSVSNTAGNVLIEVYEVP